MTLVSRGGRPTGEVLRKRELLLVLLFERVRLGESLDLVHWPTLAYLGEWFGVSERRVRTLGEELIDRDHAHFGKWHRADGKKAAVTLCLTKEGLTEAQRERGRLMSRTLSIGPSLREMAWVYETVHGYLTLAGILRHVQGDVLDMDSLRQERPEAAAALEEALGEDIPG